MISYFNNRYKGACVVIGNGPSLRPILDRHYDWLSGCKTFGSNRIFLEFTPSFYVVCNKLVIEQNRSAISMLACEKFSPPLSGIEHAHEFSVTREKIFSVDLWRQGIYEGYTVTYVSLQLAYYFGFDTVLLVGVDHSYKFDGKPNEAHRMDTDDPNHFNKEYFKGQVWNNPDLEKSEQAYQMADDVYRLSGRRIVNLTPGSKLDVFEKDTLENWL